MPCVSLHGAWIGWSCEGLAFDPLADLLAPFPAARPSGDAQPGIEIHLQMATPATVADPRLEGFIPSFFHGIVQAYRADGGFLLCDRASRVHLPLDGSPLRAEIAPPDCEITPGSTAAMLHISLTLALRRLRFYHLHAAALVHPQGPRVLIAGNSGAGKTTLTLALLEAGFDYLSDDTLLLRPLAHTLEILAFPRVFHVGEATLAAFPHLRPLTIGHRSADERRALDPRQAFPGRARPTMQAPDILLFPQVNAIATTEPAGLSQADALGQLIASSATLVIEGLPGRDENLALLKMLVQKARLSSLRLGQDMLAAPAQTVTRMLSMASGSGMGSHSDKPPDR